MRRREQMWLSIPTANISVVYLNGVGVRKVVKPVSRWKPWGAKTTKYAVWISFFMTDAVNVLFYKTQYAAEQAAQRILDADASEAGCVAFESDDFNSIATLIDE